MSVAGSATRVATTARAGRRHGVVPTRRAMCHRRRVRPDLRAKRYDVEVRAGSSPRSGTARPLGPAVYRRRRRIVGIAVAIAVIVLTLGAQATLTGSGSGPAFALLFTPWVLMPLATGCLVGLVRSGSGGWRPASPSPAAGSATVETPMAHAA